MIEALVRRFPEHSQYGGTFTEIVPHLTVAQSAFDEAVSIVQTSLPVRSRAKRAVLLEQAQPDDWREVASFELQDA